MIGRGALLLSLAQWPQGMLRLGGASLWSEESSVLLAMRHSGIIEHGDLGKGGMVRSPLSRSDAELVAQVAAAGFDVTQFQLERWRRCGLLRRPDYSRHPSAGTRVEPPDETDVCVATVLAEHSGRGRDWQFGANALFAYGLPLSEPVLRDAARWSIGRRFPSASRIWQHAATRLRATSLSDPDVLGDVAHLAADLAREYPSMRAMYKAAVRDVQHAGNPPELVKERAYLALGLRLADMAGVPLTPELVLTAKYGDLYAAIAPEPFVLASEQLRCIETLTVREAYTVRRLIVAAHELFRDPDVEEALELTGLLGFTIVSIANMRAGEPPAFEVSRPLESYTLTNLERRAAALEHQAMAAGQTNAEPSPIQVPLDSPMST